MGASPRGGEVTRSGLDDLVTFNHWLCVTRLRAAGAVMLFTLALAWLHAGHISTRSACAVCAGLFAVSGIGLCWPRPASLISVPSGLAMATAATIGHEMLLAHEHGLTLATLSGVESLMPSFLFFLLAQQCFFYGTHLKRKNTALATLADRLEESRQRLSVEARTSAALLDVARTLSSTLDAPELLARVNSTTREQLDADWSATFLVDAERGTFRLVAATDADTAPRALARLELPLSGWAPVGRLATQPVVVLTGGEAEGAPGLGTSGGAPPPPT